MLETKIAYNSGGNDENAQYLIICMHGLGADYDNFLDIVDHINTKVKIKFVFPRASKMPITVNNNMNMRAWYNIISFESFKREVDVIGINRSIAAIHELIDHYSPNFPAHRVLLAGFSQGGVMSYYAGLNYRHKLAGIISLSSYLPECSLLSPASLEMNKATPVLTCHGHADDIVPYFLGEDAVSQLKHLGLVDIQFNCYDHLMHSISWQEVEDLTTWLDQKLI